MIHSNMLFSNGIFKTQSWKRQQKGRFEGMNVYYPKLSHDNDTKKKIMIAVSGNSITRLESAGRCPQTLSRTQRSPSCAATWGCSQFSVRGQQKLIKY